MTLYVLYFIVLILINSTKCDPSLRIIKNIDDNFIPISSVVEEKLGATFSLLCELVSSKITNKYFDNQLSWVKQANATRSRSGSVSDNNTDSGLSIKSIYSYVRDSEVNKAIKRFDRLKWTDSGKYFCISLKYELQKSVEVVVRDTKGVDVTGGRPFSEMLFCNQYMFKCVSNGLCIHQHYVCDGMEDCRDGSDENTETCNGDPCRNKLQCENGRCIPTAWCCDRHHDLNCTVEIRPPCCQLLSESYEELEYVPNVKHAQNNNGARYLFISICSLSIIFSMALLLLILSKVVLFAKKTALQQARNQCALEDIALRNQNHVLRTNYIPCSRYTYRSTTVINSRTPHSTRNIILDNCELSDPLLLPRAGNIGRNDQPPAYNDVVQNNFRRVDNSLSEPPPPYTSREILNDVNSTVS